MMVHNLEIGQRKEELNKLVGALTAFRFDPTIYAAKRKTLPFVQGLRFSSLLIYALRRLLVPYGNGIFVNWGLIIDDNDGVSPECDILVHREKRMEWNGDPCPVMSFAFVPKEAVVLVISCKSKIDRVDRKYAELMKSWTPRLWLVSECCVCGASDKLKGRATAAGYDEFWPLYELDNAGLEHVNHPGWLAFADLLCATVLETTAQ